MQIHQLKPTIKRKSSRRVGRGGKRGTYSGHGSKGQKSRAGARIRPGFRGGDNPIWKLFPKQRGSSRKKEFGKKRKFIIRSPRPAIVNLGVLDKHFNDGEVVTPGSLLNKGLVSSVKSGVKILGKGELTKMLIFGKGLKFSKSARERIDKTGKLPNKA